MTLEKIKIPEQIKVIQNYFMTYNPLTEYSEEKSLNNLTEDISQFELKKNNVIIDLGWYGDFETNDGFFRIRVIRDSNWDNPIKDFKSGNQKEIKVQLEKILEEVSTSQIK
jgi:hypothetical protein